ncbi:Uncharacterized protein Rs2_02792 [Raphanus sativus]|nr:Uncharacterized protein Rs2_02792 [Raphanus sativus]
MQLGINLKFSQKLDKKGKVKVRSLLCYGLEWPRLTIAEEVKDPAVDCMVQLIVKHFQFEFNTWRGGVKYEDLKGRKRKRDCKEEYEERSEKLFARFVENVKDHFIKIVGEIRDEIGTLEAEIQSLVRDEVSEIRAEMRSLFEAMWTKYPGEKGHAEGGGDSGEADGSVRESKSEVFVAQQRVAATRFGATVRRRQAADKKDLPQGSASYSSRQT